MKLHIYGGSPKCSCPRTLTCRYDKAETALCGKCIPPTHMFYYVGQVEHPTDNKYNRFPNRRCRTCVRLLHLFLAETEPSPPPFRAPPPAQPPARWRTPSALYRTLQAFYDADPRRRRSPEADYGAHWRQHPWPGTWRVSYVRDTGEVYALHQDQGPLLILSWVAPDPQEIYYATLDLILDGWPAVCGQRNSLDWVKESLDGCPLDLEVRR